MSGHESIICLQAEAINKNPSGTKIRMEIQHVTKEILTKEHTQINIKYFLILKSKFLLKETYFEANVQSGWKYSM